MKFRHLFGDLFSRSDARSRAAAQATVLSRPAPPGSGIARLLRDYAPEAMEAFSTPGQPIHVPTGNAGLPLRLDLCCDFGPPDEDKLCNQDAAAYAAVDAPLPGLVVALADGVSNSPYSEFGARLVVQTATSYLPARLRHCPSGIRPPPAWWQQSFEQLVGEIRRKMFVLWCWLHAAPGSFLPVGWRPSVFASAVERKNVFLSTMLVAVVLRDRDDQCWGFFAHVGDGGLSFCRDLAAAPSTVDALVCDPQTILESFVGPDLDRPCFPVCSYARLGPEFLLCLATDGIARAVRLAEMLRRFARVQDGCTNVAQRLTDQLKEQTPEQVADNLSLAFLTRVRTQPAMSPAEDQCGAA